MYDFRTLATMLLSVLTGCLIMIPIAQESGLLVLGGGVLGLAIGYRRRKSHLFFYFTLISTVILASLITGSML